MTMLIQFQKNFISMISISFFLSVYAIVRSLFSSFKKEKPEKEKNSLLRVIRASFSRVKEESYGNKRALTQWKPERTLWYKSGVYRTREKLNQPRDYVAIIAVSLRKPCWCWPRQWLFIVLSFTRCLIFCWPVSHSKFSIKMLL